MNRLISVLFVMGLVTNLIKGADLLLRPHQQKWLQEKFETLTLWLDYTKPLEWYKNSEQVKTFFMTIFFLTPLGIMLFLYLPNRYILMKIGYAALLVLGIFSYFYMGAYKGGINFTLWELEFTEWMDVSTDFFGLGSILSDWLVGAKTSLQHITKPFLATLSLIPVVLVAYGINVVFTWLGTLRGGVIPSWQLIALVLLFFILVAPVFYFLINLTRFGLTGLLILICTLLVFLTELLLKIIRGICWRISEHNKGAFAAIILILTMLLGIAEAYIRVKGTLPSSPTQVMAHPESSPQPSNSNSP